jgi:hypothetical protein
MMLDAGWMVNYLCPFFLAVTKLFSGDPMSILCLWCTGELNVPRQQQERVGGRTTLRGPHEPSWHYVITLKISVIRQMTTFSGSSLEPDSAPVGCRLLAYEV